MTKDTNCAKTTDGNNSFNCLSATDCRRMLSLSGSVNCGHQQPPEQQQQQQQPEKQELTSNRTPNHSTVSTSTTSPSGFSSSLTSSSSASSSFSYSCCSTSSSRPHPLFPSLKLVSPGSSHGVMRVLLLVALLASLQLTDAFRVYSRDGGSSQASSSSSSGNSDRSMENVMTVRLRELISLLQAYTPDAQALHDDSSRLLLDSSSSSADQQDYPFMEPDLTRQQQQLQLMASLARQQAEIEVDENSSPNTMHQRKRGPAGCINSCLNGGMNFIRCRSMCH